VLIVSSLLSLTAVAALLMLREEHAKT